MWEGVISFVVLHQMGKLLYVVPNAALNVLLQVIIQAILKLFTISLQLALPVDRTITPSRKSETALEFINNLAVIPDQGKNIIIEKDISFSTPLYWQLPHIFLVDKVCK